MSSAATEPDATGFLDLLRSEGFEGEIADGIAPRLVAATDNSIYQVRPALVLHPRTGEDLNRVVRAARATPGAPMPIAMRGGGTGTNGQSLTRGAAIDVSRHLTRILELDVAARTVKVEPGVVLDQLNAALRPHGLFFPASVSTGSRATIGGMVATDASGKGSRLYGRTSAWIEELDLVLSDGTDWTARAMDGSSLDLAARAPGIAGAAHREVLRVVSERADLISRVFPDLNRGLTGYNLRDVTGPDGRFRLPYLLAGSEGTLAVTKAVTLRLARRPSHRALAVVRYAAFDTALRDVRHLLGAEPSAVEVLDDKILALAARDVVWAGIEGVLGGPAAEPVMGLNFVEFVGDDPDAVRLRLRRLGELLTTSPFPALDWTLVDDEAVIARLWSLRERSVGLLGRLGGRRQGTAFVEDTAVPPERLADFVADFRAILDRRGLDYGMYGHADVGCLHVRPALDLTDPDDASAIRPVSDEVAALTKSYGGLLWGEHGRGYRGEFSPLFFGPELFAELCRIKAAFDPLGILNPGKLASVRGGSLERIDEVPTRGSFDRQVSRDLVTAYDGALACNGNGACHSWDVAEPMCPSFKATRDRVQSPKGRAAVLREWVRLSSERDQGRRVVAELAAVEDAVKATLDTCLSCKACSNACPVKVDVPTMKSRFMADYHRTRPRPARHHAMAALETVLPVARRFPGIANRVLSSGVVRRAVRARIGLVDLPAVVPANAVVHRSAAGGPRVVLLRDSFVASFDGTVHDAAARLLRRLGFAVVSSLVWANGKAEHVLGMTARFARKARRAQALRERLAATGATLVSLDAATGLLFEQEYQAFAPSSAPDVLPIEQVLADAVAAGGIAPRPPAEAPYRVLLHCTERTARPHAGERWLRVLAHFGLAAEVPRLGCCGMAGMFGHDAEHAGLSRRIFDLSWRDALATASGDRVLATGFSCRCQAKRFAGVRPRHPVEAILTHVEGRTA